MVGKWFVNEWLYTSKCFFQWLVNGSWMFHAHVTCSSGVSRRSRRIWLNGLPCSHRRTHGDHLHEAPAHGVSWFGILAKYIFVHIIYYIRFTLMQGQLTHLGGEFLCLHTNSQHMYCKSLIPCLNSPAACHVCIDWQHLTAAQAAQHLAICLFPVPNPTHKGTVNQYVSSKQSRN